MPTDKSLNTAALVVEGGGMRGIFSTGLLDGFLAAHFNPFDFYIGVSSGSTNIAAYLAAMIGRNRRVYTDFSLRPQFIDYARFFRGGHLIDLDWLWDITIREIRLDLQRIYSKKKPFIVVLTDIESGKACYKATSALDVEHVIKASSAVPLFYRNYPEVDGRPMTDGGVADAIPIGEAIRRGARRIMVLRSRHKGYLKSRGLSDCIMAWSVRHYPLLRREMKSRVHRYNDSVSLIRTPPKDISVVEICPPGDFRMSRFCRDFHTLEEGYAQGRNMATNAITLWEKLHL
jgi:predicted patatin/cPLA2 family phospholipase